MCKAFRKGEQGGRHNPEFTMLEWYRPEFDHHQLMDEVEALVSQLLKTEKAFERVSYRDVFLNTFSVDPHVSDCEAIKAIALQHLDVQMESEQKDDWLHLLLAEIIEPTLGIDTPVFIMDYPASQSALAKVSVDEEGVNVARRFELYCQGIELANGYFELTDVEAQKQRFEKDHQLRQVLSAPEVAADQFLLAAMEQGLPNCAGVALGVDRLLMLSQGLKTIAEAISFSVDKA
ncbi:EF-P lysine aminoacylase GenX [Oceanicoccus sagamiensis]|uniref:EF-P lysine aminoacylase GenX n=1 Tax=Oceanicoccus sagamiensis TaxID=716816 RepID=UPI001F0A3828|nr:amino acid--tRNA ligase-related protein [Oceanicoccus sagamiensis]